jgi:hypothetical protein
MKTFMAVAVLSFGFSFTALAQFQGPSDCLKLTQQLSQPRLSKEQALRLCKGAPNTGPALCAEYASRMWKPQMTEEDCVATCVRAATIEPARCVEQAYNNSYQNITKQEAIDLCVTPLPCKEPSRGSLK